jgi:outer membrane protein OmpA-like peptidoglycan-associated protein
MAGWLPPFNLGYPINTTDDDLFFVPGKSEKTAYQSRFPVRSVQGEIVRYQITSFGNPARFTILGKVNAPADLPSGLIVSVTENQGKGVMTTPVNQDGSFLQKIAAGSFTLSIADDGRELWNKSIEIPPYFPQDALVIQADISPVTDQGMDSVRIGDIRFDFDESDPAEGDLKYIDEAVRILKSYPDINLSVNGYADSRGKEGYNMKLSESRARAVSEYIRKKGDFSNRITITAFGEKEPVSRNTTPDGRDEPEGRRYNRRVELIFKQVPSRLVIILQNDIPPELRLK